MKLTPTITARIVALREAGWSITSIAAKERLSVSSIQRALRSNPVKKGAATTALIIAAKEELITAFGGEAGLDKLHASLTADTIAQVVMARELAGVLLEQLNEVANMNPALAARALAAHSTAIKNHADTLRALLPPQLPKDDELPSLHVVELTPGQIRDIQQRSGAEAMDHAELD